MRAADRRPSSARPAFLRPISATSLQRADELIARRIDALRLLQPKPEPLFTPSVGFMFGLCLSAQRHEGHILQAAVQDAITEHAHLRLLPIPRLGIRRIVDACFEVLDTGLIVGLEIKRGARHDAAAIRGFRQDLANMPLALRAALPLFPAADARYHIVFLSGEPPISEGLTPDALARLYGLAIHSFVMTARLRFSHAFDALLRERAL
jgi:hypothetical protein